MDTKKKHKNEKSVLLVYIVIIIVCLILCAFGIFSIESFQGEITSYFFYKETEGWLWLAETEITILFLAIILLILFIQSICCVAARQTEVLLNRYIALNKMINLHCLIALVLYLVNIIFFIIASDDFLIAFHGIIRSAVIFIAPHLVAKNMADNNKDEAIKKYNDIMNNNIVNYDIVKNDIINNDIITNEDSEETDRKEASDNAANTNTSFRKISVILYFLVSLFFISLNMFHFIMLCFFAPNLYLFTIFPIQGVLCVIIAIKSLICFVQKDLNTYINKTILLYDFSKNTAIFMLVTGIINTIIIFVNILAGCDFSEVIMFGSIFLGIFIVPYLSFAIVSHFMRKNTIKKFS